MRTKYKILWFAVDMHHRQRYFFICGCKRIVTLPGLRNRRGRSAGSEFCGSFTFPTPVWFKRFIPSSRTQAAMTPFGKRAFYRHQSITFLAIKEIS